MFASFENKALDSHVRPHLALMQCPPLPQEDGFTNSILCTMELRQLTQTSCITNRRREQDPSLRKASCSRFKSKKTLFSPGRLMMSLLWSECFIHNCCHGCGLAALIATESIIFNSDSLKSYTLQAVDHTTRINGRNHGNDQFNHAKGPLILSKDLWDSGRRHAMQLWLSLSFDSYSELETLAHARRDHAQEAEGGHSLVSVIISDVFSLRLVIVQLGSGDEG